MSKTVRISEIVAAMTAAQNGKIALFDTHTSSCLTYHGGKTATAYKSSSNGKIDLQETYLDFRSTNRYVPLPRCADKRPYERKILIDFFTESLSCDGKDVHHFETNQALSGSLAASKTSHNDIQRDRHAKAVSVVHFMELTYGCSYSFRNPLERFIAVQGYFRDEFILISILQAGLTAYYIDFQKKYWDEIDHLTAIEWCVKNGLYYDLEYWYSAHFPSVTPPSPLILP